MRKFRFIGDPNEYEAWDKLPVYGDVYDREKHHEYFGGDGSYDVFDNILENQEDWDEVFEESTKPLRKDTYLGLYTLELLKIRMRSRPHPFINFDEDVNDSIQKAKELIKQLNEETQ